MKGADEYAALFTTGQYGRLWITSGRHARGATFHIYVLPANVEAKSNGPNNPPSCDNYVEVYGITGGQPGWTETYGWLRDGPWVADFEKLVATHVAAQGVSDDYESEARAEKERQKRFRDNALLADYAVSREPGL
jgi:hypothetical protein